MSGLQIEHVTKDFGTTSVLKGVTLDVKDSEFISLVGPSGCGKSTLLRIIAGLETPTSGKILLGGKDVTQLRAADRNLSMVFQSYALFPHMSVLENVSYGLNFSGFKKPEALERASAGLELVGLSGYGDRLPSELSGGQQQRVAVARALVLEPQVLLFDEPLSNLDAKLRADLRVEIKQLHQKLNNTMIYVTHDQTEAMTLADRIAIMKDGMIEQCSTPDEIVLNPATEYVRKFTEEIEKARVVTVEAILEPTGEQTTSTNAIYGNKKLKDVAKILASDTREFIPVKDNNDKIVGHINRKMALDIVFGE